MIEPLTSTVVMPTWVFLVLALGAIAFITFLIWANSEARHDSDLKRLGNVFDADPVRDEHDVVHLVPRKREGGQS